MEDLTYTPIDSVLQLNKAGELIQKRMKAVKVCDGLYITEPDKSGYTQFICELNGVVWLDCKAAENRTATAVRNSADGETRRQTARNGTKRAKTNNF